MTVNEVKEKYVRVVKINGKWNAYLQIDQQGFCVCEQTTKKRANWYADMLTAALQRLITNEMKENERSKV